MSGRNRPNTRSDPCLLGRPTRSAVRTDVRHCGRARHDPLPPDAEQRIAHVTERAAMPVGNAEGRAELAASRAPTPVKLARRFAATTSNPTPVAPDRNAASIAQHAVRSSRHTDSGIR